MSILLYFFIIIKIICSEIYNKSSSSENLSNKVKNNFINHNNTNKRELEEWEQIRIYVDTYYLKLLLSFTNPDLFEIYNTSIYKAKETLEKLIMVKRESRIELEINTNNNLYEGFSIGQMDPNLIKNNKITLENYDLAILLRYPYTSLDTNFEKCKEKNVILKYNDDIRPTFGYIVIDDKLESKIVNNKTFKIEFFSYYFLHQFTHILGFNKNILERKGISIVRETVNRINASDSQNNINKFVIINEELNKLGENYFGEKPNFIELEDKIDYECIENIHWDSRILLGDYMTFLIYVQEQVISDFTLKLLEETTLYKANYFTGGLMKFGRNQKLLFFEKDCNDLLNQNITQNKTTKRSSSFINEFCAGTSKTTCSSGRISRGVCYNKIINTDLVNEMEYVRGYWDFYGNSYADYCPISFNDYEIPQDAKYSYAGNCKLGNNEDKFGHYSFFFWKKDYDYSIFSDSYGETFSDHSFCAFSSVISKDDDSEKKKIYSGFIRPTCYEMFCSNTSLTIKIGSQYIVCPREGGYISIGGNYEGNLLCPDFKLICSQEIPCNNLFDCVKKGSKEKKLNYNYKEKDVSVQIILPSETNVNGESYEEDDYGKCPKHCSECTINKQCFKCHDDFSIYIGVREGDNNPINCSDTEPTNLPYYRKIISSNTYYFKCIDNCIKCSEKDKCDVCEKKYIIEDGKCKERIEGCKNYNPEKIVISDKLNGYGDAYTECIECDEERDYYCKGDDKQKCYNISKDKIDSYYTNAHGCKESCDKFNSCKKCEENKCTECELGYYIGYEGKCFKNITNCIKHNILIEPEPSECLECKENYLCLGDDKTTCYEIKDKNLYYLSENNVCFKLCKDTYTNCQSCKLGECYNCIENYFVYEDDKTKCIEGIPNCQKHFYKIEEGKETKYCIECKEPFYCVDKIKEKCQRLNENELKSYYDITIEGGVTCKEGCFNKYNFCLECSNSGCSKCADYTKNENGICNIDPESEQPSSCSVKFHEINTAIEEIIFKRYLFNFHENLPIFKVVDHYLNKDYTLTVFIYSECTEELLNQGYFKIDSEKLQKTIANYYEKNEKIIFSIFITHNLKSHFQFYDTNLTYLDTTKDSNYDKNKDYKEYIITNKYIRNINETLGPLVASLVELEKLNIFEKESDIFNNYCQNITFLGIDMPLKQRLLLLYPHKFSVQIACLGESCVISEFNFDESEVTCQCKIGNKFEDILTETKFVHFEGPGIEPNNFIESIGIIKCIGNGFNSKNIKANAGFFLVIIGIIAQIVFYILYSLCSEPITNLPKGASNPPKKAIMIFSDWDKRISKKNDTEGEVFIQPRDDADEQLLEEERTYSNENGSSLSIDTDVGGINMKKSGKNKLSEKPDRKVLILLKNKGDKNKKHNKNYEDQESESEIMKLNDERNIENISFCKLYWSIVSLKQHIINFFSFIHCCKITKSYIPLSIRIIRSIFLIFLSFVFNILFLNQSYFEKKFNHFNEKYIFIHAENTDIKVSSGERISYAISNTFIYALISFLLLIIVNFIVGFIFFSVRNSISDIIKNNNISEINDLIMKTKKKYLIFFIINIVLMVIFLLTIAGFVGAYGGGFADYFIPGIISLIFLELFPFLWSLLITLFTYLGIKTKNKCMTSFGKFFMF